MSTQPFAHDLADVAKLPAATVYERLGTGTVGLTSEEAQKRLVVCGKNVLQEGKKTPLIYKFLANFVHPMALLLWAGGIMAFIAQMPQLGIAVWIVILINAVFSFWQEFKAEKARSVRKPHPSSNQRYSSCFT